jgi:hypothetical protein
MVIAIDQVLQQQHTAAPTWRLTDRGEGEILPKVLASTNGTNSFGVPADIGDTPDYGELMNGVILAELADGRVRPCADQALTDAGTAANEVLMLDVRSFREADTVSLYASGPTKANADAVLSADDGGGNTAYISISVRSSLFTTLRLKQTDPSANNQLISSAMGVAAGVATIDVSLATGGGGAITTTVQQLMDHLNGHYSDLLEASLGTVAGSGSAAQLVVAVAATAFLQPYEAIFSARLASSIDHATKKITISGAAFDWSIGDRLVVDGAFTPFGVLHRTDFVKVAQGLKTVDRQPLTDVAIEADAIQSKVIGYHAGLKDALLPGIYVDPTGANQTGITPGIKLFSV